MKVQLLGTTACTLCDEALALVQPEIERAGLALELVDIADDETLLNTYGERIPLLRCSDRSVELGWPFSRPEVRLFLQRDE